MFSDPRPDTNLTIDAVRFQCPLSYSAWWLYNVVVVVNFTMLHIQPNSTINKSRSSVQVMLGYINDTRGIYERTPPTVLIPGVNLVGITNFYIRQTLKKPTVSAFGLFDVSNLLPTRCRVLIDLLYNLNFSPSTRSGLPR